MVEWEIKKSLGQCSGSGAKIDYDQEYFAALVETAEGLERRDFCVDYWQQNTPQVYCYWKSKLPRPDQKKQIFIDDAMLMAFFERLATETDPEKLNFRFVLTLILMRKRKLKYDSSTTDGEKEIRRLRITGQNEFAEVINPHLDEQQIQQLSSQIGNILQVEL